MRGTRREASVVSFSISILQMLSNMFFAMCGIIIHPHLNRPSQFLHSAMPIAPGGFRNLWFMAFSPPEAGRKPQNIRV